MNILVTGSTGFIGKNMCLELQRLGHEVLQFSTLNTENELADQVAKSDFVIHLAGVNRPQNTADFYSGNVDFTVKLIELLEKQNRCIPVLFSSSLHATSDSDYGKSKRMAEDFLLAYGKRTGAPTYIFRLANAFGKWSKPNYNSVVATFCYNVANNLPLVKNEDNAVVPLIYIDDILHHFIRCLDGIKRNGILTVEPVYKVSVNQIADGLMKFKASRENNILPDLSDDFTKKLYSTYLTYLSENDFKYSLKMNEDERGSFTEFIKTNGQGQVIVNISEPGIIKGNHWHHTKNEKFLVVNGIGVIRFRKLGTTEVMEYNVSGNRLEVVDIPPGYVHNIENLGTDKLITVMWSNELYNPEQPDTFSEKV